MTPRDSVGRLGSPGDIRSQVNALGGPGRGGGTRRLAESWAAASGKSVSSQMRAVQRALRANRPPARQDRSVGQRGEARVIAERLRAASVFRGGRVEVEYQGQSQGYRDLGSLSVSGLFQADLRDIADLIEQGRDDEAMERLNESVLDEYGNLGGTLRIADFEDGFQIE